MNFVIPMAGLGSRFQNAGYSLPKPLIPAHGKTLLEWSIDSLPLELCSNLIIIALQEHCQRFPLIEFIEEKYYSLQPKILQLNQTTNGQAETVFLSQHLWDHSQELLIFNADTAFISPSLTETLKTHSSDGILATFTADSPKYSYAQTNPQGFVTHTAEKIVISNQALNGLYHFTHTADFIDTFTYHQKNNLRYNNEYYIAPMYNYLIQQGKQFILHPIEQNFILGTPEELLQFQPPQS